MSEGEAAKRFWNDRARDDAFFYVDDRLPYRGAPPERFWTDGERDLDALLEAVGAHIEPTDTVLDIGCGVGRLTRVIAGRAADVVALDVSAAMLALARRHNRLDNVTWVEGDGTTLTGVPTASVTAVVSHVVFQHIPDPGVTLGYIREIGRVLAPGGWAAFQVSNDPSVHRRRVRTVRQRLRAIMGRAPRTDHRNWWGSAVELPRLKAAVADAGMSIDAVVGEGTQFCLVRVSR